MGVAKPVVDADTPVPTFKSALIVLKLAVSGTCQASAMTLLAEEVATLRRRVKDLQRIRPRHRSQARSSGPPGRVPAHPR